MSQSRRSGSVDLRPDPRRQRGRVLAQPRCGRVLLRLDAGLELGRPVVAIDEPRDALAQPQPEQQVVLGDRVGRRYLPGATHRRDEVPRGAHRSIRSGRGARRSPWSRCVVGAGASLGEAVGQGRVGRQAAAIGSAIRRSVGRRLVGRSEPARPPPGPARRRSRPRTACAGDRPRPGSSAGRPSSASRPRGRRLPPRRRPWADRGRCPWACRPSATPGGSGPCCPTLATAGRPTAGARSGARPSTARRRAGRLPRSAGASGR